nr:PREDICTED: delta-latroinsectotoxin-Lt1a-like [Bemisia tabaci]
MYLQGLIFTADTPFTSTSSNLVSCPPDVVPTSYLLLPSVGETKEEKEIRKKLSLVQTYAERLKPFLQSNVVILNEKNASHLSEIDQIKVYEFFVNLQTKDSSSSPVEKITRFLITPWSYMHFFKRYISAPIDFISDRVGTREFEHQFKCAVDDSNLHLLEGLLSRKPDISNTDGRPLLHLAAMRCCLELVRALLDHGANVTQLSSLRETPLHYAVMGGSPEIVQLLCERGADVDANDWDGFTPLFFAKHPDVANVLLENHANPCAVCGENQLMEEKLIRSQYITEELFRVFSKYGVRYFDDCRESGNRTLEVVGLKYCNSELFSCMLESCFIGPDRLKKLYSCAEDEENIRLDSRTFLDLRRYASKIAALFQNPQFNEFVSSKYTSDDGRALSLWAIRYVDNTLPRVQDFTRLACDEEVARMKSHIFPGATMSIFDLLMKNVLEVARLLRNEVFASMVDSFEWNEFNNQFPLYCRIFRYHLENGSHRKQFQEEARKILDSLSLRFKRLPSEMQEHILDFLRMIDLVNIKRVLGLPSDS